MLLCEGFNVIRLSFSQIWKGVREYIKKDKRKVGGEGNVRLQERKCT